MRESTIWMTIIVVVIFVLACAGKGVQDPQIEKYGYVCEEHWDEGVVRCSTVNADPKKMDGWKCEVPYGSTTTMICTQNLPNVKDKK